MLRGVFYLLLGIGFLLGDALVAGVIYAKIAGAGQTAPSNRPLERAGINPVHLIDGASAVGRTSKPLWPVVDSEA